MITREDGIQANVRFEDGYYFIVSPFIGLFTVLCVLCEKIHQSGLVSARFFDWFERIVQDSFLTIAVTAFCFLPGIVIVEAISILLLGNEEPGGSERLKLLFCNIIVSLILPLFSIVLCDGMFEVFLDVLDGRASLTPAAFGIGLCLVYCSLCNKFCTERSV